MHGPLAVCCSCCHRALTWDSLNATAMSVALCLLLPAVRELAPGGDLSASKTFPFEFRNVELQYDSYRGQQVRCRCGAGGA